MLAGKCGNKSHSKRFHDLMTQLRKSLLREDIHAIWIITKTIDTTNEPKVGVVSKMI